MYASQNTHRFPALVLAAGLTTAVMIGLSALANSQAGTTAVDTRQLLAATPSVTQAVVSEAMAAPLRVDVIAYRSQVGNELQAGHRHHAEQAARMMHVSSMKVGSGTAPSHRARSNQYNC